MESTKKIEELTWEINGLLDFIENASIPLHSVNGSGIIIWANKAELDFLGYSKEEYLGKHISHFHANKNIIEDILIRLTNKETLKNYAAQLKGKNGDIKSVLINSNVLWKNDEFIHTRCFTRDITDIRKSEMQKIDTLIELQKENNLLKVQVEQLKKELKQQIVSGK
jgi:two-component system, OmpR family, sensor histidine kinase VicK